MKHTKLTAILTRRPPRGASEELRAGFHGVEDITTIWWLSLPWIPAVQLFLWVASNPTYTNDNISGQRRGLQPDCHRFAQDIFHMWSARDDFQIQLIEHVSCNLSAGIQLRPPRGWTTLHPMIRMHQFWGIVSLRAGCTCVDLSAFGWFSFVLVQRAMLMMQVLGKHAWIGCFWFLYDLCVQSEGYRVGIFRED